MTEVDISPEVLERFRHADVSALWSGVNRLYRGPCVMREVKTTAPGTRMVGRARTLRYMPTRRFIDGPNPEVARNDLPEYRAIASCGVGDVLVMDCMMKTMIGHVGDVKAWALKLAGAEGIVTDGSIRDLPTILADGVKVFANTYAIPAGMEETDQYDANVVVGCGGVRVVPGDVIVAGDLGVLVVPQESALEVLEYAEDHDGAENYIKELAEKEHVVPWTYYPPDAAFIARYKREKLGQG